VGQPAPPLPTAGWLDRDPGRQAGIEEFKTKNGMEQSTSSYGELVASASNRDFEGGGMVHTVNTNVQA